MPSEVQQIEVLIHPELVPRRNLPELLERIADYSPVLQRMGAVIEEELAEGFELRGFGGWKPLKPATQREKFRLGYEAEDLVRTGKLFRALTQRDAPGHKFLVGPDSLQVGIFGAVVPYAGPQNAARYLMHVRPETREKLVQILQEWVAGPSGNADAVRVYLGSPLQSG